MSRTVKETQREQLKFAIHQVVNVGVGIDYDWTGKAFFFTFNSEGFRRKSSTDLESTLDNLFPPPTKKELQEKVDSLEKKIVELTQQLMQRAII